MGFGRLLLDAICEENYNKAENILDEAFRDILEKKLFEARQIVAANFLTEKINRNVVKQGRTKIIKVRIRGGKVQRRKKFSAVKGFTLRGGRLVRMSAQEKLHRKRGARRAKIKRRSKKSQILRKRKMSLRKRKAYGLK